MIVDDEHNIVNWLSYLFETAEDLDLEIIMEYKASDALACLQTTKVDVLLTDIQMPEINGIQLATKTQELWPSTRIIFLTGYSDFNSIYQATRLKNIQYLLKSEDDELILKTVRKCLREIEEEKKNIVLQDKIQSQLFDLFLQADFLKELLLGKSVVQVKKLIQKYKIHTTLNMDQSVYLIYMKVWATSGAGGELDYTSLCQELPTIALTLPQQNFQFGFLPADSNSFLWLFQPPVSDEKDCLFFHYMKNCFEEIVSSIQLSLHILCGSILLVEPIDWEEMYFSYRALEEYYVQRLPQINVQDNFFTVTSSLELKQNLTKSNAGMNPVQKDQLIRSLRDALYQYRQEDYFRILKRLGDMMLQSKSMRDLDAMGIYMDISSTLISFISQYRIQEKVSMKTAIFPLYYLSNFSSWEEAYQYVRSLSEILFAESIRRDTDSKTLLVSALKKYISDHLEDNLSLHTLSEQFNYNSSYISYLFKQIAGIGISEYITRQRIDRANELLRSTSDSVAEIATKAGFDTVQYFSYVYKKTMGRTPSEYRLSFKNV